MNERDSARRYARRRLRARNVFRVLLVVWFVIACVTTLVWVASDAHELFWPVWPMVGLGSGVVVVGLRAYGPRIGYISEDAVDAEVARLEKWR